MKEEEKEIYRLEDVNNCYDFEKDIEGFYKAMEPSMHSENIHDLHD